MKREKKIYLVELTAIVLLWAIVILSPLLFMDSYNPNWRAVYVMWTECGVVGFAFITNRLLLMPYLFFTKRYGKYAISIVVLMMLLAIFVLKFDGVNYILSLVYGGHGVHHAPPMMNNMPPIGMPPMTAPHVIGVIPPSVHILVIAMIVIALDMGLSIAARWIISEQREAEATKERVSAQLSNLQSQVSPHFLMNTLNNIHALVDIDSMRAKQTIIELAELMDYLLYESSCKKQVLLQREIEFINSYINLMRLRFPKDVKIHFSYSFNTPTVKIPPLLFLNFIENAFKFGVDYEKDSFIKISLKCSSTSVEMTTINSNHSIGVKSHENGLGLINTRKRLELIYGDHYTLEVNDIGKIYYVNLKIPIL